MPEPLPQFPRFRRLDLADGPAVRSLTERIDPYTDFEFASLWCWDVNSDTEVSVLDGNLVARFRNYQPGQPFLSVAGATVSRAHLGRLLEFAAAEGDLDRLRLVPACVVDGVAGADDFVLEGDRDNYDYVVSTAALADLHPRVFPKKRKLVERFRAAHPKHAVRLLDLEDAADRRPVEALFDSWLAGSGQTEAEVASERFALQRMLRDARWFPALHALGIVDRAELIAFSLFEAPVRHGFATSSFQKADRSHDGVYAALTHEAAKQAAALGCRYFNFQQDLGVEGLRSSKLSWHPVRFLEKYSVGCAAGGPQATSAAQSP